MNMLFVLHSFYFFSTHIYCWCRFKKRWIHVFTLYVRVCVCVCCRK